MLETTIIIDGRDHLLGRLASIVAKELLAGQKIVIVRCDEICVSGSLVRNRVKYAQFRNKRMNTNPRKGPFHYKSPAKMVYRTIRGMVPHMSARGTEALSRLSTFEGIPEPFDKKKRQVVPAALRVMRLKPIREFTVLGDLSHSVGWKHRDLIKKLEATRKAKAEEFYANKLATEKNVASAKETANGELDADEQKLLKETGYF
mmetsp:Transcript_736/g.1036  ORF Transcript_736/g.1036 Transcript_736/m.1036 type:complete len:203 (+) Transcript_736:79-687(+)